MLLKESGNNIKASVLINLYAKGFSFDDQEISYQYSRSNSSVSDSVNLTMLPGQIDQLLMRTDRDMQKVLHEAAQKGNEININSETMTPILYYYGGVVVEIRDYREGRGLYSDTDKTITPHTFKLFLKPDSHALHYHLDNWQASLHQKILFEQKILMSMHPDLCLDTTLDVHRIISALYYSNDKFYINTKSNLTKKRKCFTSSREYNNINNNNIQTPSNKKSKLFEYIQKANVIGEYMKDIETISLNHEKKHKKNIYVPKIPIKSSESPIRLGEPHQSPVIGKFLFSSPLTKTTPVNSLMVQECMTLETKGIGSTHSPYEVYLQLKVSSNSKPGVFHLGGPQSAARFLSQFKKLEKPASSDQLKYYNEQLKRQMPRQMTQGKPHPLVTPSPPIASQYVIQQQQHQQHHQPRSHIIPSNQYNFTMPQRNQRTISYGMAQTPQVQGMPYTTGPYPQTPIQHNITAKPPNMHMFQQNSIQLNVPPGNRGFMYQSRNQQQQQ